MFSGLVVGLSFWYVSADLGCFLVRPAIKKRLSRFRLELRARFVTGSGRFCSVLADCNENQFLLIKVRHLLLELRESSTVCVNSVDAHLNRALATYLLY